MLQLCLSLIYVHWFMLFKLLFSRVRDNTVGNIFDLEKLLLRRQQYLCSLGKKQTKKKKSYVSEATDLPSWKYFETHVGQNLRQKEKRGTLSKPRPYMSQQGLRPSCPTLKKNLSCLNYLLILFSPMSISCYSSRGCKRNYFPQISIIV